MLHSNGPADDAENNNLQNCPCHDFAEAELALLRVIRFNGYLDVSRALLHIHDLALYHSDCPIERHEKEALYDVRILAEELRKVGDATDIP